MKTGISLVLLVATLAVTNIGFAAQMPPVEETFKSFDTNNDGKLSQDEAEADIDLASDFDDIDLNHDGQLDLAEFTKFWLADE